MSESTAAAAEAIDANDATDEQTIGPRLTPATYEPHHAFWVASKPRLDDLLVALPDVCVDELDRLLKRLPADVMANGASQQGEFVDDSLRASLPQLVEQAEEVRRRLELAPGAVIIDRFPAERYSDEANRTMCGVFSTLVAPLMAQNFTGTTLYDVMDKRVTGGQQVRRSITNLAQDYHTDGGWVANPARYVGLYCIRPANNGGHSRVTSLLGAVEALRRSGDSATLSALARDLPWDRQGEHAPDDVAWESHPIIVERDGGFLSRFYADYVRNGYRKQGREIEPHVSQALARFSQQLDAQPGVRFLLEAGQYQYVNNYTIVHAREAFTDADPQHASVGGRRLIRVWNH